MYLIQAIKEKEANAAAAAWTKVFSGIRDPRFEVGDKHPGSSTMSINNLTVANTVSPVLPDCVSHLLKPWSRGSCVCECSGEISPPPLVSSPFRRRSTCTIQALKFLLLKIMRFRQGCGSGFNRVSGSGSRREKWPTKVEFFLKFMFCSVGWSLLRAEGFFCNLDVLYGGLGIGKLQFLIKKN